MKRAAIYFIVIVALFYAEAGIVGVPNVIDYHDPNFIPREHETNSFFITKDKDGNILGDAVPPENGAINTNRESLAAKDFPEGNWGEELEGVRVSLRLDKSIFTNSEFIRTTVLVRNITNEYSLFVKANQVKPDLAIGFTVWDKSGQRVPSKPEYHGFLMAGFPTIILPGTQRKYAELLNDSYDLTNGIYMIQASAALGGGIEISSAKVPLEIK
ncbi:MAG TPA: hypothetical protein VG347_23620 [Verrucomicrobiae bacterium]|nr:hypothetical protein [Verrucomicrobiae bacterium]